MDVIAIPKSVCARPAGAVPFSKFVAPVVTNAVASSGETVPGYIPAVLLAFPPITLTSPLVNAVPAKSEYPDA